MPVNTRLKRKLDSLADGEKKMAESTVTKRMFQDKTNFTSPKLRSSTSQTKFEASQTSVPLSQTGELVVSQLPLSATHGNGVDMMRCIKKVLEHNFKNVTERFKIASPPCLYDLKKCLLEHSTKAQLTSSIVDVNHAKSYLTEERPFQFMHHVRSNVCNHFSFLDFS